MKTLGIDVGGTRIKSGLLGAGGKIIRLPSVDFNADPAAIFRAVKNSAGMTSAYARVGVAVAGDIDTALGIVRFSPNLGWKNVHIGTIARKILGKPVVVENDANAAAMGAWMLDGAKRYSDIVCVTMGTGVGGGIIAGGKLLRGATGSAGEIGHMTYKPDGVKCSCGNSGCFERYLGRDAIVARFLEISRRRKSGSAKNVTPMTVAALAAEGDRAALETWRRTGEILGVLLADIVDALNPSAVIIAGAVSRAADFFLPAAVAEMRKRAFKHPARSVRIMVTGHDDILGAAGAALIASAPSKK